MRLARIKHYDFADEREQIAHRDCGREAGWRAGAEAGALTRAAAATHIAIERPFRPLHLAPHYLPFGGSKHCGHP